MSCPTTEKKREREEGGFGASDCVCLVRVSQVLVQPSNFLRGTPRPVWRQVLVSWLLAAVIVIPQSLSFVQTEERFLPTNTTRPNDTRSIYRCESEEYSAEWQRKLSFTLTSLFFMVVPACVMTFCYANIVYVVWLRDSAAQASIDEPRVHFVTSRAARERASDPAAAACIAVRHHPRLSRCDSVPLDTTRRAPRRLITLTTKRHEVKSSVDLQSTAENLQ